MDAAADRFIKILSSSFFSFLNTGVFLFELYLALKFVDQLKISRAFGKATPLVRFILALTVTSLAFPALNGHLSRYLSTLFSSSPPLTMILLLLELAVFVFVVTRLYKGGRLKDGPSEERGEEDH